ncbi:MAG: ATP-binding cassette domain-containing protein [Gammaproteobacteria bacterium]|nr:ATP-binding cassette domain-containing protein [Gammaproteobacteria bacterium]
MSKPPQSPGQIPLPDDAMEELIGVMHPEYLKHTTQAHGSDLWEVFRHIAQAERITLPKVAFLSSDLSLYKQIKILSKLGQCHLRKINVSDRTCWQDDMGSVIGFSKADHKPCALIFESSGYTIQFAGQAQPQKLSDNLVQELDDIAFACYPKLDETPIGLGSLFKFMFRSMGRDIWQIIWLRLGISLSALILPIAMGFIFEQIIPQSDMTLLMQISLALVLNLLVVTIFSISQFLGMLRLRLKIDQRLQSALWLRLLKLPFSFFKQWDVGDLNLRVSAVDQIQQILSNASLNIILSGLMATLNLVVIFYFNAQIGAFISLFALILTVIIMFMSYFRFHYLKTIWWLRGKIAAKILQIITNITKIRLANIEHPLFQRWIDDFAENNKFDYKFGKISNIFSIITLGFVALTTSGLYALVFMLQETISFGDFIVINSLAGLFFAAYSQAVGIMGQLLEIIPVYQRAKPILQAVPEPTKICLPHQVQGELELRQVSFQYEGMEQPLLKNSSLKIKKGELIGIIGSSGCGKTSLLRLIIGLERPLSGEIFFDGQPLESMDLADLRQQIGFVMQNMSLFPGTIADNIRGHCSDATIDDIAQAAQCAQIAEEIEAMPMQYHTLITNHGESLSVGQRQRLQLAHIFLAQPKLLLLDEATSALDNQTQNRIQEQIDRMNITGIIISHRLSTLSKVNRVYQIVGGELIEIRCDELE